LDIRNICFSRSGLAGRPWDRRGNSGKEDFHGKGKCDQGRDLARIDAKDQIPTPGREFPIKRVLQKKKGTRVVALGGTLK